MSVLTTYLNEREAELKDHLDLIGRLELRAQEKFAFEDPLRVEVRHVLILKSGLMVHLYNVIEAIMSRALDQLSREVSKYHPRDYGDSWFSEWIRSSTRVEDGGAPQQILTRIEKTSRSLIQESGWDSLTIRAGAGNWDDKRISKIMEKLGIPLKLGRRLKKEACGHYVDDLSRLCFIRKRRNDLAHGVLTFEEGAQDRSLEDLSGFVRIVASYLRVVVSCFEDFSKKGNFLASVTKTEPAP